MRVPFTFAHPRCTSDIVFELRRRQRQIEDGFLREWEEVDALIAASAARVREHRRFGEVMRRLGDIHRANAT